MNDKGGISVQTEHIFPVIKKWLYSDKDIVLRELVSNASDAVVKIKHLSSIGQAKDIEDNFRIDVKLDKEKKTITISDNGIGMTYEEVKTYINQIALSGALDFIKKYTASSDDKKDENSKSIDGIIGHFGLGFYSSFMIADKVEIFTKSYTDAPGVHWTCDDAGNFDMEESEISLRGTDIILHVTEEEKEYLNGYKIKEILNKYCMFVPVPLYFIEVKDEKDKKEKEEGPDRINSEEPLWLKNPSQCTDEEYEDFYRKLFMDYKKPLFHIHLNADYPLNFKGILYYPKINHEYEQIEGQVKLYYNRVFVADNIKEIIPDYLLMLRGALDCPELPLNVSRSYLQSNTYVTKLSQYIVRKVCDKLVSLFNTDRENYEKIYDDLKPFMEYASMRESSFYEKVKKVILYKSVDGNYLTMDEYLAANPDVEKENEEKKEDKKKEEKKSIIYYTNDVTRQTVYINMYKNAGKKVVILDKLMDNQFISMMENTEKNVKFMRVDADENAIKNEQNETVKDSKLEKEFKDISKNEKLTVKFVSLQDEKIPAILNISEESRRFNEMMKFYSMYSPNSENVNPIQEEATLILNQDNEIIRKLKDDKISSENVRTSIIKQIYTLALLSQRQLTSAELSEFLDTSFSLLSDI